MTEQDKRNAEDLYALYHERYLPPWADARLNGVPEQYAQLETRDGRKMGNGIVTVASNWPATPTELNRLQNDKGVIMKNP
ncbi:hypothetical protein [Pseudomonas sp. Marseille-P9899]|uniref:hypothetical protein n=1 Tax=Pseudomonas sp. Marseille-P9899 TaxID=2730401 RepID=UPI001589C493|nr:hypothetical protein [Pseudomonas sp. Marseille-P9899]